MPVPQEINFIVEQASCLFLTMVQDVRFNRRCSATIGRSQQGGLGGLWEALGRGKKPRWQESDWQARKQWLEEPRCYRARQLSQRLFC
jgi:hypothetical protein